MSDDPRQLPGQFAEFLRRKYAADTPPPASAVWCPDCGCMSFVSLLAAPGIRMCPVCVYAEAAAMETRTEEKMDNQRAVYRAAGVPYRAFNLAARSGLDIETFLACMCADDDDVW